MSEATRHPALCLVLMQKSVVHTRSPLVAVTPVDEHGVIFLLIPTSSR